MCLTECRVMKTYPLLNYAPRHEGMWGSGDIAPLIRNLGTRWMCVVSFRPRPRYSQGKSLRYISHIYIYDSLPGTSGI